MLLRSLLVALLFPIASLADEARPICEVVDKPAAKNEDGNISRDIWRDVKREATAQEAVRIAATRWREVQAESNNADLDAAWFDRFESCLRVSGRPFEEIVGNPVRFRHIAIRTMRQNYEDLQKLSKHSDITKEVTDFNIRVERLRGFDPSIVNSAEFVKEFPSATELTRMVRASENYAEMEKEKCSAKDISSQMGPVRDQSDIGWCYAFAAADLVTYRAKRESKPFRVSPADMAFQYNMLFKRESARSSGIDTSKQESGNVDKALKGAISSGFCSEKDAPSENFAYGSIKDTIDEIESFKIDAIQGRQSSADPCYSFRRTLELFPGIPFENFSAILQALGDRNMDFFEALSAKNCENKRTTLGLKPNSVKSLETDHDNKNVRELLDSIDTQLDVDNPTVVAVAFNLLKRNENGAHAMVVVGRKYDEASKSCKYLLRNSWGEGCSPGFRLGICAKDHSGHVWVSKASLSLNLMETTHLE